jgi:hypothetical protein
MTTEAFTVLSLTEGLAAAAGRRDAQKHHGWTQIPDVFPQPRRYAEQIRRSEYDRPDLTSHSRQIRPTFQDGIRWRLLAVGAVVPDYQAGTVPAGSRQIVWQEAGRLPGVAGAPRIHASAPTEHIGDPKANSAGEQERKQRLFGGTLAHIFASPQPLLVGLCCSVPDLLTGFDRRVTESAARIRRLSSELTDGLRRRHDAVLRVARDIPYLITNPIVIHSGSKFPC